MISFREDLRLWNFNAENIMDVIYNKMRSNRELYKDPSMKFWKAKLTIEYKVLQEVLKQMLDQMPDPPKSHS